MGETSGAWNDFFVAEVGATAALAGLIIVAISINLQRILAYQQLPGRALEALTILVGALLVCGLALIPAQPVRALGWEMLAIEAAVLVTAIVLQVKAYRADTRQPTRWWLVRLLLMIAIIAPIVVGGAMLASGHGVGLYWVAAGVLFTIAASVMNTWVLLVEILR